MHKSKINFEKGLSLVEAMTACVILGVAITVFSTLQVSQEKDFATLRKFDKAAYAVELMFEELAAVYNPVAIQYGAPKVFEDTSVGATLKVKGLSQLPDNGDQISIEGVGGRYKITNSTALDSDNNTVLTLERSDVPASTPNKNLATSGIENANITFISNAEGTLNPYHNLDMTRYADSVKTYSDDSSITNQKVLIDLANWGPLLLKHLGPSRGGDKRLIQVEEIIRRIPIDADNDGVTDQVSGEDQYNEVPTKQVTITIKQDEIEERFRRLFLTGT